MKRMANSSRPVTSQQFEDAFEELFRRSPMPQLVKSSLVPRQSPMPIPFVRPQNGVGVKAIFDMLKWKNSSATSELNTSAVTASTSSGDADVSNQCHEGRKEKENKTPEKNEEEPQCLSEPRRQVELFSDWQAAHVSADKSSDESRADQETLQLVSKLVQRLHSNSDVDSDKEDEDWAIMDCTAVARPSTVSNQPRKAVAGMGTEAAITVEVSPECPPSGQHSNNVTSVSTEEVSTVNDAALTSVSSRGGEAGTTVKNTEAANTGKDAALSLVSGRRGKDVGTVNVSGRRGKDVGTVNTKTIETRGLASSQCGRKVAVENAEPVNTRTSVSYERRKKDTAMDTEAANLENRMSNWHKSDSSASVEAVNQTKSLASNQRGNKVARGDAESAHTMKNAASGQLSNQRGKEAASGNTEAADTGQASLPRYRSCKSKYSKAAAETNSNSPSKRSTASSTQNLRVKATGPDPNNKNSKKAPAQVSVEQRDEGNDRITDEPLGVRRKKGALIIDDSTDVDSDGHARRGRGCPRKSMQKEPSYAENAADEVGADVIPRRQTRQMDDAKDPFSLDTSSSNSEMEVEEDAIPFASKKTQQSSRPGAKKRGKMTTGKGSQSVAQPAAKAVQKAGGNARKTSKGKRDILKLSTWSLQPVAKMKSVRIEGKLPNTDYFWMSSVIVERVSRCILRSISGSLYQLVGCCSSVNTMAAGFSKELTRLFRNGFPPQWKEIIESSFGNAEDHPSPPKTRPQGSRLGHRRGTKKESPGESPTPLQRGRNASSLCTPETAGKELDESSAIWTPQGVMSRALEANEVRRTRSGRCVIPRLAVWAGQYAQRDADGNVTIGFTSLAAEQHFAKLAEQEMHVPQKRRNMPMPTSYKSKTSPSEVTMVKGASSSKPTRMLHHAGQRSSTAPTDRKETRNPTAKGAPKVQDSRRDEGSENSLESCVLNCDVSIDDMAKEVMALVQKSKERRQSNILRKKRTCYSNESPKRGESRKSQSFEYSEDEEDDKRSQTAAAAAPVQTSSSVVTRTRKLSVRKQQQNMDTEETEDEPTNLARRTGVGTLVPGGRKKRQSSHDQTVMPDSDDEDFEEKVQNSPAAKSRRQRSGASPSLHFDALRNSSSRHLEDGRSKRLAKGADKSSRKRKASISLSDSEEEVETKWNLPQRKSQSASKDSSRQSSRRKGVGRNDLEDDCNTGEGANKSGRHSSSASLRNLRSRPSRNVDDDEAEHLGPRLDHSGSIRDSDLSRSISDFDKDGEAKRTLGKRNGQGASKERGLQSGKGKRGSKNTEMAHTRKKAAQMEAPASLTDQGEMRPWSKEEIEKLHEAAESTSSNNHRFWEVVSQRVGTRSTKECATFYLRDPRSDPKPKRKPKEQKEDKQAAVVPVLQGKRGTLKRQREIKAILEHDSNNNGQDDLFQATPFRTRRTAKVLLVDFTKTDEEVFGRNPNFFTPKPDGSHQESCAVSLTPVSSRKTPAVTAAHSPWQDKDSTRKRDVDQYVFRLKRNKRQLTKSFHAKKGKKHREEQQAGFSPPSMRLFQRSAAAPDGLFQIREEKSCDDDEEDDYYYSDPDCSDAEN